MATTPRLPRPTSRPGSVSSLRVSNERTILNALLTRGPATQSELARRTRLSNGTVSSITRDFVDRNLVQTSATISSGRKATLVTPTVSGPRVAIGIDLGRAHLGIAVVRPGRDVLAERRNRIPVDLSADDAMRAASDLMDATLADVGRTRADIIGVGFGIPGPIDAMTRELADETILPSWVGRSAHDVEAALGLPIAFANDADLGAIAERAWGDAADIDNFMFVKIGTGIGGGLVLSGAHYAGAFGVVGELGHTVIDPGGPHCRCGNRGCLETVASTVVVVRHVSESMGREVTLDEVVALARDGNMATTRVLAAAGAALGQALAGAVNLLGVQRIVLGGAIVEAGDALLQPVRAELAKFAISVLTRRVEVTGSALGERAGALGAATLALEQGDALTYLLDNIQA